MSRAIGDRAEEAAARYLASRGYVLLARNYAIRGAEVDIVAREGDCIAFVEVKSRASARYGAPRECVTPAKQRRIGRAALRWLQENGLQGANVRFDVVECLPEGMALLRGAFDYIE